MARVCTIYLVRHGMSETNKAGLIGGESDPALTEEGRQQARDAREVFEAIEFDAVYSSHLQRAVETGGIIYGQPIPKKQQLYELRERSFGELEGKPSKHLADLHVTLIDLPVEKRRHYKHVPNMESDHEVSTRYLETLRTIATNHLDETVLIVTHGSAIRSLLIGLGYATHETLPPGSFRNAGFVQIESDGKKFTIVRVDSKHSDPGVE